MKITSSKFVYVNKSSKIGQLGVFAYKDILKNSLIEICPLILFPVSEEISVDKTNLKFFYFEFNEIFSCIALGCGSLYNHSYKPNAKYDFDYKNNLMIIMAIENIMKDEEIFVNYNYEPFDNTPLETWFDPKFIDKS